MRRSSRAARAVIGVLLLALSLSSANAASANVYHAFICAVPPGDSGEGQAAPTDDVSYATTGAYMYAGASCSGGGGSMYARMDGHVTHPEGVASTDTFKAPEGVDIAGFDLWRYEEDGPSQPYGTPASNLSYTNVISVEGLCDQAAGCSSRGTSSPWYAAVNEVSVNGLSGVNYIQWTAACGGGPGGTCPTSETSYSSRYDVFSLDAILSDATPPSVSELDGAILAGGSFSGEQTISLKAADAGSGLYSDWLTVDGKTLVTPRIINTNGGACKDLHATKDGLRSFLHPQPCPPSTSTPITLNTAALKDGSHTANLYIDDAAGNQTIAKTWNFTSDNAPTIVSPPEITGSASVSSTLTSTNGTFSVPPGAGTLSPTAGQWLRCSDAPATHCSAISGATGPNYTPTTGDAGYYIAYKNTVSDKDGTTITQSQPTLAVTTPSKETTNLGGQPPTAGYTNSSSSTTNQAGLVAGGASGANGPSGTNGVNTNLLTPLPAGSPEPWRVTLRVAPHLVHRGTTIVLSGEVRTISLPSAGKLIFLMARTVKTTWRNTRHHRHKINRYGKWIEFMHLRTDTHGTFHGRYRIKLGGQHTYQFIAIAPREGGFPNPTGSSRITTIREH